LESLQAYFSDKKIQYWRDRSGREIDFVILENRDNIWAIECKWNPAEFSPASFEVFRARYPKGKNYVVSPLQGPGYEKRYGDLEIRVCHPGEFTQIQ
jgi:predicted AAA+ superfamily ATPase